MERGNLFTLSLGNVQPNEVIAVRFAYFEELEAWKDELALQIPFNPGVRYIPANRFSARIPAKARWMTPIRFQTPPASRPHVLIS